MVIADAGSLWIVLLAAMSLNGLRPGQGPNQPAALPRLVPTTSAASRRSSALQPAWATASRATCSAAIVAGLHLRWVSSERGSIHAPGRWAWRLVLPNNSPSFLNGTCPDNTARRWAGTSLPKADRAPRPVIAKGACIRS